MGAGLRNYIATIVFYLKEAQAGKQIQVAASYLDNLNVTENPMSIATGSVANINNPSSGSVTIQGTAKQGETLVASNTLADADGLGALSYQWLANGKIISGATNSAYVLTQAEVAKAITVKVSYTDLFGQPESVRSTPPTATVVNVNDVPTGLVTVSGTLKQGEVLTATNTLVDPDGPLALAISYQWQADSLDIDGAYDSTYVLTQEEVGKRMTVIAKYTDTYKTDESVASAATDVIANNNDAPTGIVTIGGITRQGEVLTANTTALADADGLGVLSYQWCVNTGTTVSPVWTSISGATESVCTLTGNEVGKTVAVKVFYTDNYNYAESVLSRPAQKISNTNDAPTGTVTITGRALQGGTLRVSNTLADADGMGIVSYQWQTDGVDIVGHYDTTLLLEEAQVGKTITAIAIYDDNGGTNEHVFSEATSVVENVNDPSTGSLRISGTAKETLTLTAVSTIDDADGLGNISYQWSVVTRTTSGSCDWSAIAGATDATIVLAEAQVGKKIGIKATYTDGHRYREQVFSNITAPVKNENNSPTGDVTISGLVKVDTTLVADNTLADDDGMGTISYQWYANDAAIDSATEGLFKLTRNEFGKMISVKASYVDGHGYNESKESTKTVPVEKIYTLSAQGGYLVNALVWIDDNGNKQRDSADDNRNGKWDKGEGESWALTDSSGQVTGLEGDGTILLTANPNGGTIDISTGHAFTGSFAAPSDAKVVSALTTLFVAAMAADTTVNISVEEKLAAAEARVKAALGFDYTVTIINYNPLAEASKTATTLTAKQIAINVESETIQVNNIVDVAVSVANAVADKALTGPDLSDVIVDFAGIIADQLLGQAQAGAVNLADATVIANVINNTLTEALARGYLSAGHTPSSEVITAIADALAKVNNYIAAIDDNADGADAQTSIREIVQAQIVAQNTIVADTYRAVYNNNANDVTDIIANPANFAKLLEEAAAQGATIFMNHTPVGNVFINGVVMPGETLTATSSLVDIEGLGTIGYQWLRDGVAITDATHETYVLDAADIGKAMTVKASYVDGTGHNESMSSDPTTAVPDAPTSLSDVVVVADTLTNCATPTVHVDLTNKLLEVGDSIQIIDSNHDNAVVGSHTITAQDLATLTPQDIELLVSLVGLIDDTHALKVQLVDGAGNAGVGSNSIMAVTVDTTLPTITNPVYASGVVTAILDAALETGDKLSGSVDGGAHWSDIAVTGTSVNWGGLTITSNSIIKLKVTDTAGNASTTNVWLQGPEYYNLALHTNYWNNDKIMPGVEVDSGFLTNGSGAVIINNVLSGAKTLTPALTASQADKGAVDLLDAIAILKSIVGLTTFNTYQQIAADFDGVNGVDLNDAIGILKHVVGLPAAIPEWVFVNKAALTLHPADPINVTVGSNTMVELIGILHGDVDGSWSA